MEDVHFEELRLGFDDIVEERVEAAAAVQPIEAMISCQATVAWCEMR